jgi:acylphosphatase
MVILNLLFSTNEAAKIKNIFSTCLESGLYAKSFFVLAFNFSAQKVPVSSFYHQKTVVILQETKTIFMKRVRVIVDGRVQGVGFRYYVSHRAKDHGIKGYVRNLSDGKVEIDAEGECDNIHQFLMDCRQGPPMSRIDEFMVHDVPGFGYGHFSIKTSF